MNRKLAMTSRHLVDPGLLPGVEAFPRMSFGVEPLASIRAQLEDPYRGISLPIDLPVTVEQVSVPERGSVPSFGLVSYRYTDSDEKLPALLHFHGGGYVLGSPAISAAENFSLAAKLRCAVISVDYPLAPEHQHPVAIEVCYAALRWVYEHAAGLHIDASLIAVKGESAGGGLAASLALLVRDRGEFALRFQHLIAPMIDDRTGRRPATNPFTGEFVWTRDHNVFAWSALLGTSAGHPHVDAYAAAARAEDLSGLPETFLSVGALDLFLEENLHYAGRLAAAGVPVELHVYPGAYHGFELVPDAEIAQRARADSLEGLRRALSRSRLRRTGP